MTINVQSAKKHEANVAHINRYGISISLLMNLLERKSNEITRRNAKPLHKKLKRQRALTVEFAVILSCEATLSGLAEAATLYQWSPFEASRIQRPESGINQVHIIK